MVQKTFSKRIYDIIRLTMGENKTMKKEDKYYTYENKYDYTDKEIEKLRNQEKRDKKRYKIKKKKISSNSFDIVDWDRVNNLTNEEVNIVHDLLKDIK
jgi:hypothetical protein|tara:strand:+ start:60 stop:353 length:294 start_codon:yes stop_codon:yes gene_type:complete